MNDEGFRNLLSAIAQQALADIESAYNYPTERLTRDARYIARYKRRKVNDAKKYTQATNRMITWYNYEVESAIELLNSPYWEWLGEALGVDADALPRKLKHQIHVVRSKIDMLRELERSIA